jgi:hypothetical protein
MVTLTAVVNGSAASSHPRSRSSVTGCTAVTSLVTTLQPPTAYKSPELTLSAWAASVLDSGTPAPPSTPPPARTRATTYRTAPAARCRISVSCAPTVSLIAKHGMGLLDVLNQLFITGPWLSAIRSKIAKRSTCNARGLFTAM